MNFDLGSLRGQVVRCLLLGVVLTLAHPSLAQTAASAVPNIPHDPLEIRALTEPEAVLEAIPAALQHARRSGDSRKQALLNLAHANACRVVANWRCQRDAGANAVKAAILAHDPVLLVRGLIAESRADIALKDYARGTRLLAEAELQLKSNPSPELSADINLAYSSMSYALRRLALSGEYASRGLRQLDTHRDLPLQARLLRNLARAQAELGNSSAASATVLRGQIMADQAGDPKLVAELALETARIAHLQKDITGQRTSATRMLSAAAALKNSQLEGMAHEVLGNAALDNGDAELATTEYARAVASFRALRLDRDELRASRSLARAWASREQRLDASASLLRRIVDLGESIEKSDRAEAADDFDARLKYLQQEQDLIHLQREQGLLKQREAALSRNSRLSFWLTIATVAILLATALFYWQMRKVHARLRDTNGVLHESESQATSLLRMSKGCVFLHDETGVIISANPATVATLKLNADDMIGRPFHEFLPTTGREDFKLYLQTVIFEGAFDGMLVLLDDDDNERHWRVNSSYFRPEDARPYVIGHAVDVTDQVRQIEELGEQSLRDELTGVYNRRKLRRFEQRHAVNARWAVVIIDMNDFKGINDNFGHERGDTILVQTAHFLQDRIRAGDSVVRLGGDEFVILLTDANAGGVDGLVERLKRDMTTLDCGFSIGTATRKGEETLAATIARADMAMVAAKYANRETSV